MLSTIETFYVYTDDHWFGPHAINGPTTPLDLRRLKPDSKIILLGDNFDRKNSKKNEFELCTQTMYNYYEIFGKMAVGGNHELIPFLERPHYKYKNVIFTHGDILWGEERMNEFRAKPQGGAGFIKRRMVCALDAARKLKKVKLDEREITILSQYAKKEGCDTIVIGHKHPKKKLEYSYNGVLIVVLPRGMNELTLAVRG